MRNQWSFDYGRDGFSYLDDAFQFTSQPGYASGGYGRSAGYDGGGLTVRLGGRDWADINGMSGGWRKAFDLDTAQEVTVTFRYKLTQSNAYEADEYSDVRFALDGKTLGLNGTDYIARISGDGNGGSERGTGWQTVTLDLGRLEAGRHEIDFGGFNNKKTERAETTEIRFDDIVLETAAAGGDGSGGGTAGGTGGGSGGGSGGTPGLAAFEARVFELTNAFRAENGKRAFENDAKLNAASEDWSEDMARGDFFRHSTPAQVEEQGYAWRNWGENIAAGYSTPEAVVRGWINSPGHRANMLSDSYKEMGVGHYYLANDTGSVNYNHYWTQTFGTEADSLMG